jgi:hypothetical protein
MGVSEIVRAKVFQSSTPQCRPPRAHRKRCRFVAELAGPLSSSAGHQPGKEKGVGGGGRLSKPPQDDLQTEARKGNEARLLVFRGPRGNRESTFGKSDIATTKLHDLVLSTTCREEEYDDVKQIGATACQAGLQEPLELRVLLIHRATEPPHTSWRLLEPSDIPNDIPLDESNLRLHRPGKDRRERDQVTVDGGRPHQASIAETPASGSGDPRCQLRFLGGDHLRRDRRNEMLAQLLPPPGEMATVQARRIWNLGQVLLEIAIYHFGQSRPRKAVTGLQSLLRQMGAGSGAFLRGTGPNLEGIAPQPDSPLPTPLSVPSST